MLMLATLAAPVVTAEEETTCAVLIDLGDGQAHWVDVETTSDMNALNATVAAAEELGWSVDASAGYVSSIAGLEGSWPNEIWNFWIWNATTDKWDMAMVGAADVAAQDVTAIAWSYAAYLDTTLFISPFAPIATPDHRYPWASARHDLINSGSQMAFEANNLTLSWDVNVGNGAIDAPIVIANGYEYIITGGVLNYTTWGYDTNSSVYCLDSDGEIVWQADIGIGYQIASPLVFGDLLIVPSADGYVYAFDIMNGALIWAFDTDSASTYGVASSPIIYQNQIIVAATNGYVYAIAFDGTEIWNTSVASGIYSSSPAAADGVIYIGDEEGYLNAIASNGTGKLWRLDLGSKVRGSPILAENSIVVTYLNYTGTSPSSGGVASVSYDGDIIWQTSTEIVPGSAAMTSEGYAIATTTGISLVGFDGELLWSLDLGTTFAGAAPIAIDGTIFAVTNEESSRLVAVDLEGNLIWEQVLLPSQYALCSPTVSDGTLYASADNGYVYSYQLNNVEDDGGVSKDKIWYYVIVIFVIVFIGIAALFLLGRMGKKK